MPAIIQRKRCVGPCGSDKPITDFFRDATQSDGHMARCKSCVMEARREREARRKAGEVVPRFSLEERKRRSDAATRMHAEGRLGGSGYGSLGGRAGRPRKPKITDAILEHFQQDQQFQLLVRALESNLRSNRKADRLAAAKEIFKLEIDAEKNRVAARGAAKAPEDMTPDELHELLEQGLSALLESGDLSGLPFIDVPAT